MLVESLLSYLIGTEQIPIISPHGNYNFILTSCFYLYISTSGSWSVDKLQREMDKISQKIFEYLKDRFVEHVVKYL